MDNVPAPRPRSLPACPSMRYRRANVGPPLHARVLVVDDDRITRDVLGGLLRGNGMEVEFAESGQAAIDRVTAGGIDLVLLDIIMPGLSGVDTCRLLKSIDGAFVPVVLVTARTDLDSRIEGLRIGADDYVCKPFDERELLARVDNLLRLKRMHDEVNDAKARLEELAVRDELTGLYNYRYLHTRLQEEFKRAERYHDPLACAMVDIDFFKLVNDTHGHDVGDAVIAEVAQRLRDAVREIGRGGALRGRGVPARAAEHPFRGRPHGGRASLAKSTLDALPGRAA